jgi:hypothetical protein
MQTKKKISVLVLTVMIIGLLFAGCRGAKRQGCPTFNSIEVDIQQSEVFNG